ncbi:MAG: hypothetical protein RRZ69_07695, partial [Clostridia bacterium]
MKILVINGSPKGNYSVTLQTVLYLQKKFANDDFEFLNVGQQIKKYEKEKNIEQRIAKYINNKFSFVCIKVTDKKMRSRFEEG